MRGRTRRLVLQALYQWQLTGDDPLDIARQFNDSDEMQRADADYFQELFLNCTKLQAELIAELKEYLDRPATQLDPIEQAILLIGGYEFRERLDVPFRVVINEGVELAKKFGAEESYKYINAVLDKAAVRYRAAEVDAASA